jgi:heat-inducible transcriptional repressor
MITPRSGNILNYIVRQYIATAIAVPSQSIADKSDLGVSPATIRNEMAQLEREGYLIRPHTSAGCIPSDKGYRYYVESMESLALPREEQYLIAHTFHQVEKEVETWVSLTASLLARLTRNVAVVSLPKSTDCRLKHMEIMAVQDARALVVVVLDGAVVRQKLITFDSPVTQPDLSAASSKLNASFAGLTGSQILKYAADLTPLEKKAREFLVEIMKAEDSKEFQDPYLEGWQFMLNQPEFAQTDKMRTLMELVEQRGLLKVIIPASLEQPGANAQGMQAQGGQARGGQAPAGQAHGVHVIIGKENQFEAIQNCSVVVCRYGLPEEVSGTIAVVGPTRMPYSHTIPTVYYLSSVLSQLLGGLYGKEPEKDAK